MTNHRGAAGTDAFSLTVIIPTMNQADLLCRCLDKLIQQTDQAFSLIIVNDGSTDETEARVRERVFPFPTTLLSIDNGGPARARNLGVFLSSSSWVAFLDDDVVPDPGWVAAIRAHAPDAEVLIGMTTSTALAIPSIFSHQIRVVSPPPGPFPSCNFAARRSVFDRCGGFDTAFVYPAFEDTDWSVRIRAMGVEPQFIPAMRVDHPPRPSTYGSHIRRLRYQASAVRYALKHRRIGALFGVTDVMQYAGAVGTAVFFDTLAMWPFLVLYAVGLYVRTADFLKVRSYTPKEALQALTLPLLTPWLKLLVFGRAALTPRTWRYVFRTHPTPSERLGPPPTEARLITLPASAE